MRKDTTTTDQGAPRRQRARSFARDRRGSAAVQFALIAGPFFYMLIATMETAMIYIAQSTLDFAVTTTQREIRTGQAQRDGRSAAEMRQLVCTNMQRLMNVDCTNALWLDVDAFPSLSGLNPRSPISNGEIDMGQINYNPGGPDSIVLVRAYYAWKVRTPFLAPVLSNMSDDRRLVTSSRLMRVEPYPVAGGGGAP